MATATVERDYIRSTSKISKREGRIGQVARNKRSGDHLRVISRHGRTPSRLHFTSGARPLLTPFRLFAFRTIHEIACRELGSTLKSATVFAYYDHYEPVPPILMLTFVADVDRYEWSRARKAITKAEVMAALSWTEAEKADSAKMIYFQIVPLKI